MWPCSCCAFFFFVWLPVQLLSGPAVGGTARLLRCDLSIVLSYRQVICCCHYVLWALRACACKSMGCLWLLSSTRFANLCMAFMVTSQCGFKTVSLFSSGSCGRTG